jgi:hypothetical protein
MPNWQKLNRPKLNLNDRQIRTSHPVLYTKGEISMVPALNQQVRHPEYDDRIGTVIEVD